jgi:hypothetical protein
MKGSSNGREITDKLVPEIHGTEERLHFLDLGRDGPIGNSFRFRWGNGYLSSRDDRSKVFDGVFVELTFDWFARESIFSHRE